MKRAEDWFKEGRSKTRDYDDSIEFLKQIQRDAMQECAEIAGSVYPHASATACKETILQRMKELE